MQASGDGVISTRAQLRKRTTGAIERPAVVWGRDEDKSDKRKDAVAPAVAGIVGDAAVEVADVEPVVIDVPVESDDAVTGEPVEVAPEITVVEPTPTVPVAASAPMSRRARRLATGAQPVRQPVADSTDSFELVSDVAEAERAEAERADAERVQAERVQAERAEAERAASEAVVEAVPVETESPASVTPESMTAADETPAEAASDIDAFESAARLFSFTGEVKVTPEADATDEPATESTDTGLTRVRPVTDAAPGTRRGVSRGTAFRRVATMSFSVGVMGVVGLLTVGLTTPAEAMAAMGSGNSVTVLAPGDAVGTQIDEDQIQAYVAPATVENATLERSGGYDTVTTAELASESGISNVSNLYVNDPNAAIQWPFAVGVPYSYGFGMRSGRMHEGIDFTPGAGSPIQAIADGTVRVATEAGGAYGVHVIIDHIVDGQLVSSHYAHMQYGTLQVSAGQKVTVGTMLGRTGNTGRSYGAHTHFEILMNGTTPIDPLPWLQNNAGRSSLG